MTAPTVSAVAQRLGVELPEDYRRFLETTNGGCPEPDCFMVPDRGPALVGILYGIGSERTHADIEYEQEQLTQWNPLPLGFFAVGDDPGGNVLLLGTRDDNVGRVFFWDRVGIWVREDGKNTFPVAASFTDFLASLRRLPPEV